LSVGLGVCIAASIHVAAAIPNLYMLEYQPPVFELANSLLVEPLRCLNGHYNLPAGSGLGVQIDEARLQQAQA
jgi:galactonate dehydratase